MAYRGSISVDVDLYEILPEIETETLVEELTSRGQDADLPGRDLILEAIREIHAKRYDDALVVLERAAWPKWKSVEACRSAYYATLLLKPPSGQIQ